MKGSIERISAIIQGEPPDRPALFDLLRNDAVLSHFSGRILNVQNADDVVYRAYEPAIDATRPLVRLPSREETVTLPDGRTRKFARWTTWTESLRYADSGSYLAAKRREIESLTDAWSLEDDEAMRKRLSDVAEERRRLGNVFFFPSAPGMPLMNIIGEVGLEAFSYYLADCPGLVDDLLEAGTCTSVKWIEHLPEGHGLEAVFCGDDIAHKGGCLLSPRWLREHYLHRLERVTAAYHRKGIKVLFHSDGDLNPIMDGLVDAGIDGLNPIEVLAGMSPGDIHRRYPHLFMAGGIDVSQMLPFGTPAEVRNAVRKALDETECRLMIGSSTELNDEVPLENFLAMREAVLTYQ
jgi:hypothetical protein